MEKLQDLRREMVLKIEEIKSTFPVWKDKILADSQGPIDEAEVAQSSGLQIFNMQLRHRQLFYLQKLENALQRIDEGTYGQCEDCGDTIGYKRLLARPTAHLCINCKQSQEHEESRSVHHLLPQSSPVISSLA